MWKLEQEALIQDVYKKAHNVLLARLKATVARRVSGIE